MFSRRTAWDRTLNPLAERLEQRQSERAHLIDLSEANPTRCGFTYPTAVIQRALASAEVLTYDPDPLGHRLAREAVSTHYQYQGAQVDPEDIVLAASTSEAYAYLFKMLCDPGDNVVVFAPGYPLLEYLTALENIELRRSYLIPQTGWTVDVEDLQAIADERTRAVVVLNPGNPTGQFLKRWELVALAQLCAKNDWALIADEVFSPYALDPDPARLRTVASLVTPALTFCLNGLSKLVALPQLKLGWVAACGPAGLRREAMERLELVADTFLSVSSPVQLALPTLLEEAPSIQRQILDRLRLNRAALRSARSPEVLWSHLPVEAGWCAVLQLPRTLDEEKVCLDVLEDGVVVQPGYFFDFKSAGYLVISLLPEPTSFVEGVKRISPHVR